MTAQASPIRLIGPAVPESSLCLSESDHHHILLVGAPSDRLMGYEDLCQQMEIDTDLAESHHELPFRLHHARPIAVIIDLPVEGRAMAAALRCIAAYNPSLPVFVIAAGCAAVFGTLDAARALWGLGEFSLLPPQVSPRGLILALFRAGRAHGNGRLMPIS